MNEAPPVTRRKLKKKRRLQKKRKEKAELQAQEEAVLSSTSKVQKIPALTAAKKNASKKKDELSLLEEALVGDAEKKAKEKKREERLKKEREERAAAINRQKLVNTSAIPEDPMIANTEEMIGSAAQYFDDGSGTVLVGSKANRALGVDNATGASGLDAALGQMSVGSISMDHPEKKMKALHMAFEERMMPIMKEDFPGLKMSQYKEKIFNLWKKSPENPLNWPNSGDHQQKH